MAAVEGDLFDWDPDAPESPSSGPLPANPFPAPTLATSPRATTFTPSVPSGSLTTGSNPRLPPQRGTAVPPRVTAPVRGAAPLRGQLPLRVSTPIPIPGNQMKKSTSDDKIAESPPIPIPGPQATNASFLRPPASTVNAAREDFGFGGQLVLAAPPNLYGNSGFFSKGAGSVEVVSLRHALRDSSEQQLLNHFPGPLTNQKKVEFKGYPDAIERYTDDERMSPDVMTLWNLLHAKVDAPNANDAAVVAKFRAESLASATAAAPNQSLRFSAPNANEAEIEHALRAAENMIVEGRLSDALSLTVQGNMWAHSLLLAQMLDEDAWAEVVLKIARPLPEGSAMRALILAHAGRSDLIFPEASVAVHQWKPALSVILANLSANSKGALNVLGDALWAGGATFAAHLCYVLGERPFDRYGDAEARMVLMGTNHTQFPRTFATSSPLYAQLSELVEFIRYRNTPPALSPNVQVYKLLYAMHLADRGLVSRALDYVRAISAAVKAQGRSFSYTPTFAKEFTEFTRRLETATKLNPNLLEADRSSRGVGSLVGSLFGGVSKLIGGDDSPSELVEGGKAVQMVAPQARFVAVPEKYRMRRPSVTPPLVGSSTTFPKPVVAPLKSSSPPPSLTSALPPLMRSHTPLTSSASSLPSAMHPPFVPPSHASSLLATHSMPSEAAPSKHEPLLSESMPQGLPSDHLTADVDNKRTGNAPLKGAEEVTEAAFNTTDNDNDNDVEGAETLEPHTLPPTTGNLVGPPLGVAPPRGGKGSFKGKSSGFAPVPPRGVARGTAPPRGVTPRGVPPVRGGGVAVPPVTNALQQMELDEETEGATIAESKKEASVEHKESKAVNEGKDAEKETVAVVKETHQDESNANEDDETATNAAPSGGATAPPRGMMGPPPTRGMPSRGARPPAGVSARKGGVPPSTRGATGVIRPPMPTLTKATVPPPSNMDEDNADQAEQEQQVVNENGGVDTDAESPRITPASSAVSSPATSLSYPPPRGLLNPNVLSPVTPYVPPPRTAASRVAPLQPPPSTQPLPTPPANTFVPPPTVPNPAAPRIPHQEENQEDADGSGGDVEKVEHFEKNGEVFDDEFDSEEYTSSSSSESDEDATGGWFEWRRSPSPRKSEAKKANKQGSWLAWRTPVGEKQPRSRVTTEKRRGNVTDHEIVPNTAPVKHKAASHQEAPEPLPPSSQFEESQSQTKLKAAAASEPPNADKDVPAPPSLLSRVKNIFSRNNKVKPMHFGEDNSFYFNEELKMWVERGKEDEYKTKAAPPPPPPKADAASLAKLDTGSGSTKDGDDATPAPSSTRRFGKKGTARKYVSHTGEVVSAPSSTSSTPIAPPLQPLSAAKGLSTMKVFSPPSLSAQLPLLEAPEEKEEENSDNETRAAKEADESLAAPPPTFPIPKISQMPSLTGSRPSRKPTSGPGAPPSRTTTATAPVRGAPPPSTSTPGARPARGAPGRPPIVPGRGVPFSPVIGVSGTPARGGGVARIIAPPSLPVPAPQDSQEQQEEETMQASDASFFGELNATQEGAEKKEGADAKPSARKPADDLDIAWEDDFSAGDGASLSVMSDETAPEEQTAPTTTLPSSIPIIAPSVSAAGSSVTATAADANESRSIGAVSFVEHEFEAHDVEKAPEESEEMVAAPAPTPVEEDDEESDDDVHGLSVLDDETAEMLKDEYWNTQQPAAPTNAMSLWDDDEWGSSPSTPASPVVTSAAPSTPSPQKTATSEPRWVEDDWLGGSGANAPPTSLEGGDGMKGSHSAPPSAKHAPASPSDDDWLSGSATSPTPIKAGKNEEHTVANLQELPPELGASSEAPLDIMWDDEDPWNTPSSKSKHQPLQEHEQNVKADSARTTPQVNAKAADLFAEEPSPPPKAAGGGFDDLWGNGDTETPNDTSLTTPAGGFDDLWGAEEGEAPAPESPTPLHKEASPSKAAPGFDDLWNVEDGETLSLEPAEEEARSATTIPAPEASVDDLWGSDDALPAPSPMSVTKFDESMTAPKPVQPVGPPPKNVTVPHAKSSPASPPKQAPTSTVSSFDDLWGEEPAPAQPETSSPSDNPWSAEPEQKVEQGAPLWDAVDVPKAEALGWDDGSIALSETKESKKLEPVPAGLWDDEPAENFRDSASENATNPPLSVSTPVGPPSPFVPSKAGPPKLSTASMPSRQRQNLPLKIAITPAVAPRVSPIPHAVDDSPAVADKPSVQPGPAVPVQGGIDDFWGEESAVPPETPQQPAPTTSDSLWDEEPSFASTPTSPSKSMWDEEPAPLNGTVTYNPTPPESPAKETKPTPSQPTSFNDLWGEEPAPAPSPISQAKSTGVPSPISQPKASSAPPTVATSSTAPSTPATASKSVVKEPFPLDDDLDDAGWDVWDIETDSSESPPPELSIHKVGRTTSSAPFDDTDLPDNSAEFDLDDFDFDKEMEEFEKTVEGVGIWDDLSNSSEEAPSSTKSASASSVPKPTEIAASAKGGNTSHSPAFEDDWNNINFT